MLPLIFCQTILLHCQRCRNIRSSALMHIHATEPAAVMTSFYATAMDQVKKDRHIVSWSQEEDDLLREQVTVNGSENWAIIAAQFKDKTGRQCRRRWLTYLSTDCKKGGWSQEEDMLLCEAQKIFGNRWTEIAKVVSGRTDNAVKNRFSTLCKKRSKHHTISKENNDSCVHQSSKKIMVEPSENNRQIMCDGSYHREFFNLNESLATTTIVGGVPSRPPLTVLTQGFNNLSCFSAQCHLDSSGKSAANGDTIEGTTKFEAPSSFLRKDDPKLTALLQQAELLSSLATKAYSENRNQGLEDAWKELQNYLIRTQDGGNLRKSSGADSLLNNFKGLFEDFECVDTEFLLPWSLLKREVELEESQTSSEMSTGCTHSDQGSNIDRNQLDHCSLDCNKGRSHKHVSPTPVKFICQGEVVTSPLKLPQNDEGVLDLSKSEFDSPFHSFAEEVPSPEFSASEKRFVQSALGTSSPKPISNSMQAPCKSDPQPNSNQSHSCRRVLLNSL